MALDTPGKRLAWARRHDGRYKTAAEAARAFGWRESTYHGHENGDRIPSREKAKKYAHAYKVRWEWILEGDGQPTPKPGTIRIAGEVSAGDGITPFDSDPGLGNAPSAVEPDSTAVVVHGNSMYPRYFDGEILYYSNTGHSPAEFIGKECVVKLTDGRQFIKILRKGSKKGHFNLESWNAPTIEDQPVEWASPVTWRRG